MKKDYLERQLNRFDEVFNGNIIPNTEGVGGHCQKVLFTVEGDSRLEDCATVIPVWFHGEDFRLGLEEAEGERITEIFEAFYYGFQPIDREVKFAEKMDEAYREDYNSVAFPFSVANITFWEGIRVYEILSIANLCEEVNTPEHSNSDQGNLFYDEELTIKFYQAFQSIVDYLNVHTPIGRMSDCHIWSIGFRDRDSDTGTHIFYATSSKQDSGVRKPYDPYFRVC
ncbi:MAG: hypothetical protein J6A02_11745 [Prevotella sp.]|nr:hypothetical protein [Prevotella sp.]